MFSFPVPPAGTKPATDEEFIGIFTAVPVTPLTVVEIDAAPEVPLV